MALDVQRLDTNEHIFGMEYEQYNCFQNIFKQFFKRAGISINECSDTGMNIKYIVKIIDEYIQKTDLNIDKNKTSRILECKGLLNIFLDKNVSMELLGE